MPQRRRPRRSHAPDGAAVYQLLRTARPPGRLAPRSQRLPRGAERRRPVAAQAACVPEREARSQPRLGVLRPPPRLAAATPENAAPDSTEPPENLGPRDLVQPGEPASLADPASLAARADAR